jgi:hypothetical protein
LVPIKTAADRSRRIADMHPVDIRVRGRSDAIHRNSCVDERSIPAQDPFGHGGPVEKPPHFVIRHQMTAQVAAGEEIETNKREVIHGQTEAEIETDMASEVGESDPGEEAGCGRQRRPAAVAVGISPTHPCRTPDGIRRPAPTPATMMEPAAVMKRRPSP